MTIAPSPTTPVASSVHPPLPAGGGVRSTAVTLDSDTVTTGRKSAVGTLDADLESYRRELTAYCYRMLGSGFEAEDAVQETMVRAWRGIDGFEGRSALRSWLYRIATNVCLDMLKGPQRRARPMDLGPSSTADAVLAPGLPEHAWVQPVPDARVVPVDADPAEVAATRDSVRLAFVAALQHLPPRQRAVLILREVLRWHADEVAELLDTTVVSVNSALQRARATLEQVESPPAATGEVDADLLARYVDAFERYDMEALTALIHEDATQSMPPFDLWLRGRDDIFTWWYGPGIGCKGSRVVPTVAANGSPAFGQYKPSEDGGYEPWALQVLEIEDGKVVEFSFFLDTETLFPLFGLPDRLAAYLLGQDVGEAHERHELEQLGRRVPEPDPAAAPARRELEPGERVDGDGVDVDAAHVAERDGRAVRLQHGADAVAQAREIVARDRAVDRERRHRQVGLWAAPGLIGRDR